jgi:hypothetical protein
LAAADPDAPLAAGFAAADAAPLAAGLADADAAALAAAGLADAAAEAGALAAAAGLLAGELAAALGDASLPPPHAARTPARARLPRNALCRFMQMSPPSL